MRQKYQEILAVLEGEAQEIPKYNACCSTWASLLTEMTRRLNDEFDI
jgi:chorismate-pyruvate lyase